MLKYREYRNKFTENAPEVAESPEAGPDIAAKIDAAIDNWVRSLKVAFVSNEPQKRGLWDRFKNTVANVWHGRDDVSNPYKYVNKFGDNLGQPQESARPIDSQFQMLSLSQYQELKDICDSLEVLLEDENPLAGTENLRLMRMIDQKAQELKASLRKIVGENPSPTPESLPEPTAPTPSGKLLDPNDDPVIQQKAPSTQLQPQVDPEQERIDQERKDRLKNHSMAVSTETPAPPEAKVPWEHLEGDEKYTTRPVQGKRSQLNWDKLNSEEQEKWNVYGGGIEHKNGRKPLKDLPWIIRLGDPRNEYLRTLSGNVRQVNTLESDGRIETSANPIQSKQDLENRVREIKNKIEERKKNFEENPNFSKHIIKQSSSNTPIDYTQQDFKTGEIPPPEVSHTPHNGLGTPAHQTNYKVGDLSTGGAKKEELPPKEELPKEPVPYKNPEVPPPHDDEDDPLVNDAKLSKKKLMDYMLDPKNKIEDEQLRNDLFLKISKIKKGNPIIGPDLENAIAIRDAIWQAIENQEIAAEKAKSQETPS